MFYNAWRGYSFHYPQGWQVLPAPEETMLVESPGKDAVLELHLLPSGQMMTAQQMAELFLRRFGTVQFQALPGGNDGYIQMVFANEGWSGMLSVHLTAEGGTLGVGRLAKGSEFNIEPPLEAMLNSLSPVAPIARSRWVDPNEQAFGITCPVGWKPQASINPSPGMGNRVPAFSVLADFAGEVFVVRDMQTRMFINGSLPEAPKQDEGFFGKLGRMAKQVNHSMASAFGEVVCPFPGLRPALEHFFFPHWQKQLPGCEILRVEEYTPTRMEVRLSLPTGAVRVYRLEGEQIPVPGMTDRWVGGHVFYYQAPQDMMSQFEPVLRGIAESHQGNPQWKAREQARVRQQQQMAQQQNMQMHNSWMQLSNNLHQARMNDIQMAGQSQQAIANNYSAISDMMFDGWKQREAISGASQHQMVNAIRGTDDFMNVQTGAVFNLPSFNNNYWENTTGEHIVGSDFHLQMPPNWTRLERLS